MATFKIGRIQAEIKELDFCVGVNTEVIITSPYIKDRKFVYKVPVHKNDEMVDVAARAVLHYHNNHIPDRTIAVEVGIIDTDGSRRYTMTLDDLNRLYKNFEDFVADCTQEEYNKYKESIISVYSLLHKHINAETLK